MTHDHLLWIGLIGLAVAGVASIGVKVLHHFSIAEFEEYCLRRQRKERFGDVLDGHEDVALGAESLRSVALGAMALAGGAWMIRGAGSASLPAWESFAACAAGVALSLLIVTGWIPWAIVRLWSAPFLFYTWRMWRGVAIVLWPLSIGVRVVDAFLRRLAGRDEEEEDEEEAFEDEIRSMVTAGQHEGLLEQDAREMIEGVIDLSDTDVAEIMTPRSNIDAVEVNLPRAEMTRFAIEVGRTRIPVYEKTLDNIVGVLFVKDLLSDLVGAADAAPRPLNEILRKPWFVPETKPVDDMLQEFLRTRSHLAIVLDEYQSVCGVVTIEDVLEEIVGEIVDETDRDVDHEIEVIDASTAEAVGHAHLDELNEQLGIDLPRPDDFDTIAGLVVSKLGYIPKTGESITHGNVCISVLDASKRRVNRVRVSVLDPSNGIAKQT